VVSHCFICNSRMQMMLILFAICNLWWEYSPILNWVVFVLSGFNNSLYFSKSTYSHMHTLFGPFLPHTPFPLPIHLTLPHTVCFLHLVTIFSTFCIWILSYFFLFALYLRCSSSSCFLRWKPSLYILNLLKNVSKFISNHYLFASHEIW
jgi:hypothetical protein